MLNSKYTPPLVVHFLHLSSNLWIPLPLLLRTIHRAIFSRLRTKQRAAQQCVSHRCKQVVIRKSQVWWINRMGKNFPAECFRRVTNRFYRMWWRIVMKKIDFTSPLSIFWLFSIYFQAGNDSNRSIVVGNV